MGARQEAIVPARAFVELAQQHEQLESGSVQARGQGRNRLAEVVGVRSTRKHELVWRAVILWGFDGICSAHVAS